MGLAMGFARRRGGAERNFLQPCLELVLQMFHHLAATLKRDFALAGKPWTELETKLALYLYFQLTFGQLDQRNPEVIKLAGVVGRTPSSIAMKLANIASLDPKITESGRKGLQGASAQDRRIWDEDQRAIGTPVGG